MNAERTQVVLDAVLSWSRARGWRGYNKHDALNSPILDACLGWGRWPRIIAIQSVMRAPVNLRPLLLVPRTYNPKGLALFVLGLLDRHRQSSDSGALTEATSLLDLLLELRSPGDWSGDCWGYHYPWCDPGFFAPANTPNAVVTSFVCEAFLDAYRVTGKATYLQVVEGAIRFFMHDLAVLKDQDDELCLAYMPLPMSMRVLDVSVLVSSVLAQHAKLSGSATHLQTAHRLVRYVVRQQTDYGGWYYTDPPTGSRIRHDNYHTGFILDALWRYMDATGDTEWAAQYWAGLSFYAENLFNSDGSPRWMSDQDYPHDIHGAAQGILTFSRHDRRTPGLSSRIADWAIMHMYHSSGRFYYQRSRVWVRKFTLLRWCNAWMFRALAHQLVQLRAQPAI